MGGPCVKSGLPTRHLLGGMPGSLVKEDSHVVHAAVLGQGHHHVIDIINPEDLVRVRGTRAEALGHGTCPEYSSTTVVLQ